MDDTCNIKVSDISTELEKIKIECSRPKANLTVNVCNNDNLNATYRERRETVFELLDLLDCQFDENQVGMFVWAKIPEGYKTGFDLSDEVLENTYVFITPGGIFGSNGDQYIRVSLCSRKEVFKEAINRIKMAQVKTVNRQPTTVN